MSATVSQRAIGGPTTRYHKVHDCHSGQIADSARGACASMTAASECRSYSSACAALSGLWAFTVVRGGVVASGADAA